MYAVIKTGGKQYRVQPDDILEIERLPGEAGDILEFDQVLMLSGDAGFEIGTPVVSGALVAAELVEQTRGDKIKIFKKKRRKHYRRTMGHRQDLSQIRITEILTGGAKPTKAAAAKKTAPAKKAAKAEQTGKTEQPAPAVSEAAAEAPSKAPAEKAPAKKAPAKKAAKAEETGKAEQPAPAVSEAAAEAPKKAAATKAPAEKAPAKKAGAQKAPAKKAADKTTADKKASGKGDDLTLIAGVGPVIAKKLEGLGITTWKQIAALTPTKVAEIDEQLNFKGRIEREEWIEQAKDLAAGKPPRAKSDKPDSDKQD